MTKDTRSLPNLARPQPDYCRRERFYGSYPQAGLHWHERKIPTDCPQDAEKFSD